MGIGLVFVSVGLMRNRIAWILIGIVVLGNIAIIVGLLLLWIMCSWIIIIGVYMLIGGVLKVIWI